MDVFPSLLDSSPSRVLKQFQEIDSYDIWDWWWSLPLPLLFWFFFSFLVDLCLVISSRTGLFFSPSQISLPLIFAVTGWNCQMAPLGKSRSTVVLINPHHFISPRLVRRTTPAGTFPAAASDSQSGTSHSFTKTSPLLSPVVCIHLSAWQGFFLWFATNIVTHLWFFFFKKQNKQM